MIAVLKMAAHVGKFRERIEEFLNKYPAVDEVVGKASTATKVCLTMLSVFQPCNQPVRSSI